MSTAEQRAKAAEKLAEELLNEDSDNQGTGEISQAGRGNPDRPGIGSMGGYAPDSPGEAAGHRTSTFIEHSDTLSEDDVLDETDKEYLQEYLEETEP